MSAFTPKENEVSEVYVDRCLSHLMTCTDAEIENELELPQSPSPEVLRATERQALARLLHRSRTFR